MTNHRQRSFMSPLSVALSMFVFRMADDTPAVDAPADPAPAVAAEPATGEAADDTPAEQAQNTSDEQPASVAVDVPAQHVSLIKRAVALLERGETWISDNIHAGISHFEDILGIAKTDAEKL